MQHSADVKKKKNREGQGRFALNYESSEVIPGGEVNDAEAAL